MWIYGQRNGVIIRGDARILVAEGTGYAGRGPCRNEPSAQAIKNAGPLPRGLYTLERVEDNPKTGPFTIVLSPDRRNEMHGRSAFLIHGDDKEHDASEGCIILDRKTRERVWASGDRILLVAEFV